MPTYTTNYHLAKPLVNSAVDQDLWGGELNDDMDTIDTTLKSLQDQITALSSTQLPVGSIYMNYSDNTNPATLLGYGTWTSLQNNFLIGAGGTYAAGTTGGATTHTLTAAEIPPLVYTVAVASAADPLPYNYFAHSNGANGGVGTTTVPIATNAGGGSHSILNPYIAVYMWRRTA